jgi:Zinc binding domain
MNGQPGSAVPLRTVKALLRERALQRLEATAHYFCADPACEVVYFDETGRLYHRTELRERVWQKEPFSDRRVCYCFDENEADIRAELQETGQCLAVARVQAHIAAGRCACDIRNPRGVCCLSDLRETIERVREAL